MADDNYESYLCTLKEMILDEQKLVTYVSLSKELCIHVNRSKTLLKNAVQAMKEEEPTLNLNVNYMISGLSADNKACTTICTEHELSKLKETLNDVYFCHIYSVSKGMPSVDRAAFSLVNTLEDFLLCTGLVKSTLCVKRSSSEICNLKSNSQNLLDEQGTSDKTTKKRVQEHDTINKITKKSVQINKVTSKDVNDSVKIKTEPDSVIKETKSESSLKKEALSSRKDLTNNRNSNVIKKNGNGMQKGIAGFFTKSNSLPSKKTSKIDDEPKKENQVKENIIKSNKIFKIKDEPKKENQVKENNVKSNTNIVKMEIDDEKPIMTKNGSNNKNGSLNVIKKPGKVHSKRKRLLHVSDSESEDDKNDPFKEDAIVENDSEDEIPPTPSVNTIKITSGIVNPKKKRKIIDKTYTDEDGYILTRKEEVYESCSDNEVEVPTKEIKTNNVMINSLKSEKSPAKNKTKKTKRSPPTKGKQATLMNFFKKA